jgi:hypothetical protein
MFLVRLFFLLSVVVLSSCEGYGPTPDPVLNAIINSGNHTTNAEPAKATYEPTQGSGSAAPKPTAGTGNDTPHLDNGN